MSDTTDTTDVATVTTSGVSDTGDTGAIEPAPGAHASGPRATGGQTLVDRYLSPLLIPVAGSLFIIFYVLNLSRAFLSGKGTIAVIAGSLITAAIVVGASALAAAPKMRSSSLTVVAGVAVLLVLFTGWITVGTSQEKKEAKTPPCGPVTTTISVIAETALKLTVDKPTFKAGCVQINYSGAGGHTLVFRVPGPSAPILDSVGASGPLSYAWNLTPGTYTIYCSVTGHAEAGMVATLTVT